MTRIVRTLFAALSLCLLLAAAKPTAACGGPEDFARMEVRSFLSRLGMRDRVERIEVRVDAAGEHGTATVRLKKISEPLRLGLEHTEDGWVVTSRGGDQS